MLSQGRWIPVTELRDQVTISFKDTGDFYLYSSVFGTASGVYERSDNRISLYASGKEYMIIEILSDIESHYVDATLRCRQKNLSYRFRR